MPQRIKRERKPGWRAGAALIVDRSSRYGNPWRIIDDHVLLHPDSITQPFGSPEEARTAASNHYRAWLHGAGPDTYKAGRKTFSRPRVLADLWRLKGRDLACTCPLPDDDRPDPCHARVLMEFAAHPERLAR